MYILPVARKYFNSETLGSSPALGDQECAREILRLLKSGCSRISPCVDEYKELAVLGFHPPVDDRVKNSFYAFLGPKKALWALQSDIRQGKEITEELLIDIFHLQ